MTPDQIQTAGRELRAMAQSRNHRFAVVLIGSERWTRASANLLVAPQESDAQPLKTVWVSDRAIDSIEVIAPSRAVGLLGQEFDALVFDIGERFDADALGATVGLVKGGGVVVIRVASQHESVESVAANSLYLQRFLRLAHASAEVYVFTQSTKVIVPICGPADWSRDDAAASAVRADADQQAAVAAIKHVVSGHRRRPLVLTADRGRGKSAALGLAAGELLLEGRERIIVTAPRPSAAATVLRFAQLVSRGKRERHALRSSEGVCEFIAPDELIRMRPAADLVIVDEAAAIPVSLLTTLLRHYSRIVFSTTVHGYEGSGRGFALRFNKVLNEMTPQWVAQTLTEPMRWAAGDPVERWISNALLLDGQVSECSGDEKNQFVHLSIARIEQADLARSDVALRSTAGLLVQAHYQTTPKDFQFMLDDPSCRVWLLTNADEQVWGAALVSREGPVPAEMLNAISQGRRRLHGQLLPQTLIYHQGLAEAASIRFCRIVRVAVIAELRKRGLGSKIVTKIESDMEDDADVIGASFAADADSLSFWIANSFVPVSLGTRKDHASGMCSVVVLKGTTAKGRELVQKARVRFENIFFNGLSEQWRDTAPDVVLKLLRGGKSLASTIEIDADARERLVSFAHANGHYEACAHEIRWLCIAFFLHHEVDIEQPPLAEAFLLVRKILQQWTWQEIARERGLPGRKQACAAVRQAVSWLLTRVAPLR